MNSPLKCPILAYQYADQDQVHQGVGYLVQCTDGSVWCIPAEEDIEKPDALSGGFQIDLSLIQEEPDSGADRKLYLCQPGGRVVQPAPQTLPSIVGPFPGY